MAVNHPAVASFFERMTFIHFEEVTLMLPEGRGGIKMHVIPIEKTIEIENESINIEQISYWLSKTVCHFDDIHLIRDRPKASKMVKAEKIFPYAQIRHEMRSIDNNKLLLFRNKDDEDEKRQEEHR